ncbi:hypothetical protein K9L27_00425 [Candidatus Gracilibacteria bacterium]|nr:hypothetical protein [Candidatus Gracilibacteria bacterium]
MDKKTDSNLLFQVGDRFFEQGVIQGMDSFKQIITISTYALGFLILLKTEFLDHITNCQKNILIATAIFFLVALLSATTRNYFSGNGLCERGLFYIELSDGNENPKKPFQETDKKRKILSKISRGAFGLGFVGIVLIFILELLK